ncbi:MAG: transcriptional regulator [Halanaerobiales bacterium]|nr:transcriptional regulator [Halanaerobiales bacterium]
MSEPQNFGQYVRYLRELREFSILKLANLSGISPSYVSLIEKGKRRPPQPNILEKLAYHLDIGYYEIMVKAGYLTKTDDDLIINDDKTKDLFVSLTEGKKELLKVVDGLSEEALFLLAQAIQHLQDEKYKEKPG